MKEHNKCFDYLRIFAIATVLFIHGSDNNAFLSDCLKYTVFAVPVFMMMAIFLAVSSIRAHDQGFKQFIIKRTKRIVIPFLFWSLVYVFIRQLKSLYFTGEFIDMNYLYVVFLGSASYQLWFVPTLFYFSILFYWLVILFKKYPRAVIVFVAFCFILTLGTFTYFYEHIPEGNYIANYLVVRFYRVLPYAFFALILALSSLKKPACFDNRKIALLYAAVWSIYIIVCSLSYSYILQSFAVLIIFVVAAVFKKAPESVIVRHLASYSMGIYLIHGIFLEGLQTFCKIIKIDISGLIVSIVIIIAAFCFSYITSVILSRIKYLRIFV